MTRPLYLSGAPKRPASLAEPLSAEQYQRLVEVSLWNADVQRRKEAKKNPTVTPS